jgi:hypothetical protein
MRLGTRVRSDEDDWEEPRLYSKTTEDRDTRHNKRQDWYYQDHNMPDLVDSSDEAVPGINVCSI